MRPPILQRRSPHSGDERPAGLTPRAAQCIGADAPPPREPARAAPSRPETAPRDSTRRVIQAYLKVNFHNPQDPPR